jgi:hypothetical protein
MKKISARPIWELRRSQMIQGASPVDEISAKGLVVEEDIWVAELGIEARLHVLHAAQNPVAVAVPSQNNNRRFRPLLMAPRRCSLSRVDRLPMHIVREARPALKRLQ